MKTIVIISITILLNSCFYSKELNQWKSKKYNDNHFYNALKEPVAMDTNNFKLNQIYICKTDSGTYRHVLFTKDQKVYASHWTKGPIEPRKMLEKQQHIGYFYTRHDTIVIEDISVVSLVKRNGNKGKDIAIFHLKTLAVANSDTLLMSNRPSFHKNKDWDNKKWEVFYRPTKYAKY